MKALPGLLLLLLPFGSAGAQAPLVTIAGGNTVDLCAGCEHPQIRVTVTPAPKFRPKENPIVAEVSVGTLRDGDLQRAFEAKWEKGSDNYPVALILNVDAAKVTRAATYSVILDLQPVTQPGAPRLTLQVQHPAAQLQVPSRLIIDRVCGSADDKQDLYIGEVLGRSAISDLQVSPALQPSVLGNQPVTGQLRIAKGIRVEAGKTSKVDYDLTGNFPLGTVTGAVQLTAPELTQSVPLNFEVRSRLPLIMVFVYALAGALASWLLKVILQGRIELNEARIKAEDLLKRVKEDVEKHLDPAFREAIRLAVSDLETARSEKEAVRIEEKSQALDLEWRDALRDLATRRQTVRKSFDDLRSVTDNTWQISKAVAAVVAQGKQELGLLAAKLSNDDLEAAADGLQSLQVRLGLGVKVAAIQWQQAMSNYFDVLEKPESGISSALKAGLKSAVEKQQSALVSIKDDTPCSTVADILNILSILTVSISRTRTPLSQLKTELSTEISQAAKKLASAPDPSAIANLNEEVLKFAETLPQVADSPEVALNVLPAKLEALYQAWRDALLKQLGTQVPGSVVNALSTQDYLGAVSATVAAFSGSVMLKANPQQAAPSVWPSGHDFVPGPIASFRTSEIAPDLPRTMDRTRLTSSRKLFRDKSLQSLILLAMVGFGGLMLFQSTFVGTLEDFSKIFLWAFGLDLTLDAVRQATRLRTA